MSTMSLEKELNDGTPVPIEMTHLTLSERGAPGVLLIQTSFASLQSSKMGLLAPMAPSTKLSPEESTSGSKKVVAAEVALAASQILISFGRARPDL